MANALRGKITEYGNFISQTLQPQLQNAVDAREETEAEISEYIQLQNKLQQIEKTIDSKSDASINTIVDISHATIYCNTHIPNLRTVYVNIGFGFHVEMTLSEAILFINKRIDHLENNVLKHQCEVAAAVAKDVENALEVLEEFGEKLMEMEGESKRNY